MPGPNPQRKQKNHTLLILGQENPDQGATSGTSRNNDYGHNQFSKSERLSYVAISETNSAEPKSSFSSIKGMGFSH
jgi:hypothetical protein